MFTAMDVESHTVSLVSLSNTHRTGSEVSPCCLQPALLLAEYLTFQKILSSSTLGINSVSILQSSVLSTHLSSPCNLLFQPLVSLHITCVSQLCWFYLVLRMDHVLSTSTTPHLMLLHRISLLCPFIWLGSFLPTGLRLNILCLQFPGWTYPKLLLIFFYYSILFISFKAKP